MSSSTTLADLAARLADLGLRTRNGFVLVQELDQALLDQMPAARALVLIGNVGSEMWRRSGAGIVAAPPPDPLDRWTREVIAPIADAFCGKALFPFDGPPYWLFQRWAMRAEAVAPSPLGILMHPEYGLWHAYRAAILLSVELEFAPPGRNHPCDTCAGKPCLANCPVGAFTGAGYEVDHCVGHVAATKSEAGACFRRGCLARLACPIGAAWRYAPDHAQFHMRAFLTARQGELQES